MLHHCVALWDTALKKRESMKILYKPWSNENCKNPSLFKQYNTDYAHTHTHTVCGCAQLGYQLYG